MMDHITEKNIYIYNSGLQIRVCNQKLIFLFLNKTYVVGTQKNPLNETVLLSTKKHMFKLMAKKIFTILHPIFCLSGGLINNNKYSKK